MKRQNAQSERMRGIGHFFAGLTLMFGLTLGTWKPLCAAVLQTGCHKRESLDPKAQKLIEEFRNVVVRAMEKAEIPGAAIALVDEQGILWTEGFGHTGGDLKRPVTPDTPFLVCGISKLITATSVMIAVQDGLVKLDEPITGYLQDFRINSRYEEHPERKITLGRLLSYTAGIPVEATVGNYFEPCSMASFQDHVKSLFGVWLACPIGDSYYHSGASSDLAAYTIQVASGIPFERYLKERLFRPLRMANSTADRREILGRTERAVGQMMGMSKIPATYPALGAGGIYSSARDLARLVQLHLNYGLFDGRRVVDQSLMEAIQRPVGLITTDPNVFYGMGVTIDRRAPSRADRLLWQDGQGFGFQSMVHWYPEYALGAVVVTNKWPHPATEEMTFQLTDRWIKEKLVQKRFLARDPDRRSCIGTWWGWPEHKPTPFKNEWRRYLGTYSLRFNEYSLEWWAHLAVLIYARDEYTPRITIAQKDGVLCLTESKFFERVTGGFRSIDQTLQEVRPGVYATKGGGVLDFSRDVPTWCNYRLEN